MCRIQHYKQSLSSVVCVVTRRQIMDSAWHACKYLIDVELKTRIRAVAYSALLCSHATQV